jgi:excisionase family DNA binding protein
MRMVAATPSPLDERPFYSVQDAADVLRVSRQTIYRQIYTGDLRSFRVGDRRLIRRDDLEAFLLSRES